MKPLYLRGSEPLSVSLDGPALKVAQDGAADRRFPLGRVSRVVVSNRVTWTTEALLACADEGITVCFLSRDGVPRARWTGRPSPRSEFTQRWSDFADRPDWPELFSQWRIAVRRRAIRFCALRMGWTPRQNTRELVRILLTSADPPGKRHRLTEFRRQLHGLAHARAVAELSKLGLRANDDAVANMLPVLSTAIQWGLHPELVRWLRTGSPRDISAQIVGNPDSGALIAFVERNADACMFHVRDTLLHLKRYLESIQ